MITLLGTTSPFYAFEQSDYFGRIIVLLLMFISMVSWFLMMDKWLLFRQASGLSDHTLKQLEGAKSFLSFTGRFDLKCPIARVHESGCAQLRSLMQADNSTMLIHAEQMRLPRQLSSVESESVRNALERTVADEIAILEDKMGLISTVVAASPFFGLLGTVWGVMGSFAGMAEKGSANIGAIAPGISGALLTTVAGLLVAIPSLIGYNLLANKVRKIVNEMDGFVDNFMANLTLHKVKRNGSSQ
ncbi:MAG: MotA/TolQ/ExbB proton channel family protein [Lentisphaeraceae bacterium]|nr:MotA/TolQ/ExbB proton channel family protein [Lentisphaeraceae bacterium]